MQNMNELYKIGRDFPETEKMPVLFIGHGSPMNAIEENEFVKGFRDIVKTIPVPNAILCVSAHWFINGTKVTVMENPKTIHDFGGFPPQLYEVQYPAKGDPGLAVHTRKLLGSYYVELDEKWGLDHGAWTVLKHMYPKANVPVVQLSIDYTKPASWHFELARNLKSLRNKGVLIIGSGNIIHNLRLVDFQNFYKDNYGYDWAIEAKETINKYITAGNFEPLINYDKSSKAVHLAVPTPDHFLPLIYTLALQQKGEDIVLFNDKLVAGSLSMTSMKIS